MLLLSPLFLLFGLTAAVPLILHLYQQRKRTVLPYSTNRFFTQSIIRAQRRMRIRRLLLLLLRMAACIFLACAVAQPILTLLGMGAQTGSRDVILVIDDSLSMQANIAPAPNGQAPQTTRFDRAKDLALGILARLGSGDRAAILTTTGKSFGQTGAAGIKLTTDIQGLINKARGLEPTYAGGDAGAALARAAQVFEITGRRARVLLALSDFQASDWPLTGGGGGTQTTWAQPSGPVDLIMVNLGPPPAQHAAPQSMALTKGAAVVGQPDVISVRVVNFGQATVVADLVVRVDGQEQARRPTQISGQSAAIEPVPITFDAPGSHRISATLECSPPDALPQDGSLYTVVRVVGDIPVLLIDGQAGDAHNAHRQSPAFYLKAAMLAIGRSATPGSPGGTDGNSGGGVEEQSIRPDVVSPAEFTAATRLDSYRVVALVNVRSLSRDQVERLEEFVKGGGGLTVFLGDQCDAKFYNDVMGSSVAGGISGGGGNSGGGGGLLPAEIIAPVGNEESGLSGEPMHILQADTDHPTLGHLKGQLRGALAGVDVYRVWEVKPRDAWVYAGLSGNRPLLLERNYGRGKVILCTTAPTPGWTNLPLRRVFVTIAGRTVSYLAGGRTRAAEHEVGNDLPLPRLDRGSDKPVQVNTPAGSVVTSLVRMAGAEVQPYLPGAAVNQPGFYFVQDANAPVHRTGAGRGSDVRPRARPGAGDSAGDGAGGTEDTIVAVNAPRSESDPTVLDFERARKCAGDWRLQVIDLSQSGQRSPGGESADTAAAAKLLNDHKATRGVWDVLLWIVLALVLLEPVIANRLVGARPTTEPSPAPAPGAAWNWNPLRADALRGLRGLAGRTLPAKGFRSKARKTAKKLPW